MNKKAYQLTLDEWEAMLDRGPVTFRDSFSLFPITITIARAAPDCYAWHEDMPNGNWIEVTAGTLLELFLLRAIGSDTHLGDTIIDADAVHVAALPEAIG